MNCKKANNQISLLVDGLLTNEEEKAVLEHVKVCDKCGKLYEDMKKVSQGLSSFEEMPLPEGAENRIHFALKREKSKPKKKRWIKFVAIAMPATAAVVVITLSIAYTMSGGMSTTMTASDEATMLEMDTSSSSESTQKTESAAGIMSDNAVTTEDTAAFDEDGEEFFETTTEEAAVEESEEEAVAGSVRALEAEVTYIYSGESFSEMEEFVYEFMAEMGYDEPQEAIMYFEENELAISLSADMYENLAELVEGNEDIVISEDSMDGEWSQDTLITVNFLFQENE